MKNLCAFTLLLCAMVVNETALGQFPGTGSAQFRPGPPPVSGLRQHEQVRLTQLQAERTRPYGQMGGNGQVARAVHIDPHRVVVSPGNKPLGYTNHDSYKLGSFGGGQASWTYHDSNKLQTFTEGSAI